MKIPYLNRRRFLKKSSLGILATGFLANNSLASVIRDQDEEFPKIKEYRRLGRTGFKVSDLGTGAPYNEGLLRATLKSGVNLIETSEMYGRGRNETLIGSVINEFERETLFIVTKVSYIVREFESSSDIISRVDASLERMQTDYIDCLMIHGAENSDRVRNKHFHNAVKQLKREGKIRFTGISCHGHSWWDNPEETFEEVLMTAINDGRFDIIMLPYNFIDAEMGARVLKACNNNDIGTLIMKSNPIQIYDLFQEIKEENDKAGTVFSERYQRGYEKFRLHAEKAAAFFGEYGISGTDRMKDAAMQFVLSNNHVSSICCLFPNFDDLKKYLSLSGTKLEPEMGKGLADYRLRFGNLHCRIGCNLCEASCPHHLPVNTILRYNYYFQAKKQEKNAMSLYHDLKGNKAGNCIQCEGFCESSCPHGVLTMPLLALAHHNLSLDNTYYT